MIHREIGTASNIKAKSTRKKVLKALNKANKQLSSMEMPENGFFLFAAYDGV